MGKRALTGESTRKRVAAADNSFNKADPTNVPNPRGRKSNNNGAVKSAKAQSKNNSTRTGGLNQILFDSEEYTPSNEIIYRRHEDDNDEDNETNYATNDARSTGSNDMTELIGLFQSKTKKRSSSKFNEFEHEQEARLEKAREMIDGESGIITTWATEMEGITSNIKRKIDDRLERDDEYNKKLKLGFEKYQSIMTETLDNLTKLHTQSQRLGRDFDNDLKQLYATDEAELNEALEQFIKQQNHVRKTLLHANKKDHDITALKKRLSGKV